MKISEAKNKFVFTTRIDLDDENYIILREPTILESQAFQDKDGNETLEAVQKIFPKCIVESSFENEEGKPAKGEEIYNFLKDSSSMFQDILQTWIGSIPFQSRIKKQAK